MRYRSFGREGRSVSAVTLALGDEPRREGERMRLVYAALELGVNSFELSGDGGAEGAAAFGRAAAAAPREALVVALRLPADPRQGARPFGAEWVAHAVERFLNAAGLDRVDLLTLQLPAPGAFSAETRGACNAARAAGRVAAVGVAGAAAALDSALLAPDLDVMAAPYNLRSEWVDRNRLKAAAGRGLAVMGVDSYPRLARDGRPREPDADGERGGGLFGLGRRGGGAKVEQAGGYGFLDRVSGWTPAEVCLAYALTEPVLSSVLVQPQDPKVLEGLAEAAERDLPTGLPAQIEMARFAA